MVTSRLQNDGGGPSSSRLTMMKILGVGVVSALVFATPAAAVNVRLNFPQGQRIIPIENSRLLFPEAFLDCVQTTNGVGIELVPATSTGGTIAGATFNIVRNDVSRCGGTSKHCLIANNPNPSTTAGATTARLQCGGVMSPFLQFITPASGGSRLLCRNTTTYSYTVTTENQQTAPDYVSFRLSSDDADALDLSSMSFVDAQSAVLLRTNSLDNNAANPYLYYCPDPTVLSPIAGSGVSLRTHQQQVISSGQCVSFHSAINRQQYTHWHGVFLIRRTAVNDALSGAISGLYVTFQAANSWGGTCQGQMVFQLASEEGSRLMALTAPPVATVYRPSATSAGGQATMLSDGTYGMTASSGKAAFSLAHAAGTGGANVVPPEDIVYSVTPIDLSPNCMFLCYVQNPGDDSCFTSNWPQQTFMMGQQTPDGILLFLQIEAQVGFGPCVGTVEIRRLAPSSADISAGESEPLYLSVSTLKIAPSAASSSDTTILGDGSQGKDFRLMDLVTLQGVQSRLFDGSTPRNSNRRGGFDEFLNSPLVSKSDVASSSVAAQIMGPAQVSVTSAAGTSCLLTTNAGSGQGGTAGPITLSDASQVVSIRATGSTPCTIGITPASSSQSAPIALSLGSTIQQTTLTFSPVPTTVAPTTPRPSETLVQNTQPAAAASSSSNSKVTIIIVVVVVVVVVLAILGCIGFCCRNRIRACLRGRRGDHSNVRPTPPIFSAGGGKLHDDDQHHDFYHSDEDNPAASLRGNNARMRIVHDIDPMDEMHPTDMPGSPTLIAASPRRRANGPHFQVAVPMGGARVVDEDEWDDATHQSYASPKAAVYGSPRGGGALGMASFARQTSYASPHSPAPNRLGGAAGNPEAALAAALSTSLSISQHASPYNPALRGARGATDGEFMYHSPGASVPGGSQASPLGGRAGGRARLANPLGNSISQLRSSSMIYNGGQQSSPQGFALQAGSPTFRNNNSRRISVVSPLMLEDGQTTYTHTPQRPRRLALVQDMASPHDPTMPAPGARKPTNIASSPIYAGTITLLDTYGGGPSPSRALNSTVAPRDDQATAAAVTAAQQQQQSGHYPYPTSPASPTFIHMMTGRVGNQQQAQQWSAASGEEQP